MANRIFVVEDDHACETILRRIIGSIDPLAVVDWEESAENAIEALACARGHGDHYDLIIADIFLSGEITGLDLWRRCQTTDPETPVLLTSSLPVHRFFEKLQSAEAAPTYLCKPFFPGECKQIIEGLLTRH